MHERLYVHVVVRTSPIGVALFDHLCEYSRCVDDFVFHRVLAELEQLFLRIAHHMNIADVEEGDAAVAQRRVADVVLGDL